MKFKNFPLLLLLFAALQSSGQKKILDSLKRAYAGEKQQAVKTAILKDIAYRYFDTPSHGTNYDSLQRYFNLLTENYPSFFAQGDSLLLYGKIVNTQYRDSLDSKSRLNRSISYFLKAIPFFERSGDLNGAGEAYLQVALTKKTIYRGISVSNSSEIISYLNKAINAFERAGNKKNVLSTYMELQINYQDIGNEYFADLYLEKAYLLSKAINDDYEQANILTLYANNKATKAIGGTNFDIINIDSKLSAAGRAQLEDAVEKLKTALPLWTRAKSVDGYIYAMNDLAYFYAYLQDKDSALHYGFLLLDYTRSKKNEQEDLAAVYGTVGDVFHSFKDYDRALVYMDSCYFIARELGIANYIKDLAANYARIYSIKKNYAKAFEFQRLYIHLNDSMSVADIENSTAELQTKYETEKKEGQILSLNLENKVKDEENKRQRLFTIGSIAAGIVVLLFALFILRSLRANKRKNKIIEQQKLAVEEQKTLVEEKHREITDSINYARRIQRSLLASKRSLDEHLVNYFILFAPKDVVSGDFYWAKELTNGQFALVTADSTGHGVPGAIMSMLNIACLNEVVSLGICQPNEILFETRKRIIDHLKNDGSEHGGKDGMDCSLISFDREKMMMHCACANNPVWVIRRGEMIELKPDKMPVGKHDKDNEPFQLQSFQLEKNDMVYTLTDGYADQFGGPKGKKFMSKPLRELLLSSCTKDLGEQKIILNDTFNRWKANSEQVDDVTIVGIRV